MKEFEKVADGIADILEEYGFSVYESLFVCDKCYVQFREKDDHIESKCPKCFETVEGKPLDRQFMRKVLYSAYLRGKEIEAQETK